MAVFYFYGNILSSNPKPGTGDYIRVQINGKQKHAFSQKKNAVDWFKETVKAGDTVNIKR